MRDASPLVPKSVEHPCGIAMPSLDFALCLWMHRRAANVFHTLVRKIFRQIASDIGRAIVAEQARFVRNLRTVAA